MDCIFRHPEFACSLYIEETCNTEDAVEVEVLDSVTDPQRALKKHFWLPIENAAFRD